jgi:hypothetical protein
VSHHHEHHQTQTPVGTPDGGTPTTIEESISIVPSEHLKNVWENAEPGHVFKRSTVANNLEYQSLSHQNLKRMPPGFASCDRKINKKQTGLKTTTIKILLTTVFIGHPDIVSIIMEFTGFTRIYSYESVTAHLTTKPTLYRPNSWPREHKNTQNPPNSASSPICYVTLAESVLPYEQSGMEKNFPKINKLSY